MKLRNRKTGEIIDLDIANIKAQFGGISVIPEPAVLGSPEYVYTSLAELNKEWEDVPEKPETYWYIGNDGKAYEDSNVYTYTDKLREKIGNKFVSEEEAEKAVEKLKAWKRLKDKGFRFTGWEDLQAEMDLHDLVLFNRDVIDADNVIGFKMDDYDDCIKDLNTCFGGEE